MSGQEKTSGLYLVKSFPLNQEKNQTCSGNISFVFNQDIQSTGKSVIVLDKSPINSQIDKNILIIPYQSLARGTNHVVTIKKNAVIGTDKSRMNEDINIYFSTIHPLHVKERALPDFIVNSTVGHSFTDAIEAANNSAKEERFIIFVEKNFEGYDLGYHQYEDVDKSHHRMSLYGSVLRRDKVSIIGEDNLSTRIYHRSPKEGISSTAVLALDSTANNLYMQDITIENTLPFDGDPSRAVTIQEKSSYNIYKNVRLISGQDTYYTQGSKSYLESCEIHGTVDFICGSGDIFFKNSLLYTGAYPCNMLTAHNGKNCKFGYVFDHCTVAGQQGFYYGRPWYNKCKTIFLHTNLNVMPYLQGWNDGIHAAPDSLLGEYNNHSSENVFVSQRGKALSAAEASEYSIENIFGNEDGWYPSQYTLQLDPPAELKVVNSLLKWDDNCDVLYWAIVKDGKIIDFTINNNYPLKSAGRYSIRSANYMGGLGQASSIINF